MPAARVFLPVLGAPFAHAPVLRFDLARMFERPISRRLSGENKTWRGALMMTAAAAVQDEQSGDGWLPAAARGRVRGTAASRAPSCTEGAGNPNLECDLAQQTRVGEHAHQPPHTLYVDFIQRHTSLEVLA